VAPGDITLLTLKDVIFRAPLTEADVLAPDLPARLADALDRGLPVLGLIAVLPGFDAAAPSVRR
jgi:hypothetical protein